MAVVRLFADLVPLKVVLVWKVVDMSALQILVLAEIFVVTQFVYLSGSNPTTTTTATKSSEISTAESSTTDAGSYF